MEGFVVMSRVPTGHGNCLFLFLLVPLVLVFHREQCCVYF